MTIKTDIWVPDLNAFDGPKYRAIADALAADIKGGVLETGARLPPQRELAWALGVTLGTVTRAYQEAERRGLVGGEVGRGTFVRPSHDHNRTPRRGGGMPTDWYLLDTPDEDDEPDAPIPMQFTYPPGDVGVRELREALVDLAQDPHLGFLLGYQPPTGTELQLRAAQFWFEKRGLKASAEGLVISSGAHNGILAVLATICRSGSRVATERLVYPGLRAIARILGLELVPVDLDREGLRPDSLESVLAQGGVDAIYCVPTMQNPTNAIMSDGRRREIARIAREYDVPVVEDDLFGMLPKNAPAPLTALLPDIGFCVTSLSKSVCPGLRVGFIRCPARIREQIAAAVRASTWMAAPLMTEIASRWILDGTAERLTEQRRAACERRRDVAARIFDGYDMDMPDGAVHGWLHLPEPWHASQFVAAAKEEGVTLSSAHAFSIGRERSPFAVRICLGPPRTEARLEDGLRRLTGILTHHDPMNEHAVM